MKTDVPAGMPVFFIGSHYVIEKSGREEYNIISKNP